MRSIFVNQSLKAVCKSKIWLGITRISALMALENPVVQTSLKQSDLGWTELDLRFSSVNFLNFELNLRFSSRWFGFKLKFRTELFHHYSLLNSLMSYWNPPPFFLIINQQSHLQKTINITWEPNILTLDFILYAGLLKMDLFISSTALLMTCLLTLSPKLYHHLKSNISWSNLDSL